MTKTNQALFAGNEETKGFNGANQLNKTAQLTAIATSVAHQVLATVLKDQSTYSDRVTASQSSHDEMDRLIEDLAQLQDVENDFLKEESPEVLDKMLKSQQSKRSRSKSKTMTQENYTTMLTAAVAENLLRAAMGKPKGAGGGASIGGDPRFSDEQLKVLADDQEKLAKAIRNVQSKKSIAKSKSDFSEESDKWQQLLVAEKQLKDLRNELNGLATKESQAAIEATKKANELLEGSDIDKLSAKDAKALLQQAKEMLAGR